MLYDFETEHLAVDHCDRVWLLNGEDPPSVCLGTIDGDWTWPARSGPESKWLLTEWGFLQECWEDAREFSLGCREAAKSAYERAAGIWL